MNLFVSFESLLYIMSVALFYPVVIGLVLTVFWVIIYSGGFLRELLFRRRREESPQLEHFKSEIEVELATAGEKSRGKLDLILERKLQHAEMALIRALDKIRCVIRIGPSLGLMGTLIPMGVALASLAQGDMPAMASSMVTAFTTTIVGLACGVAAYMIALVQEKWVREDINSMEYFCESLLRDSHSGRNERTVEISDEVHVPETDNQGR